MHLRQLKTAALACSSTTHATIEYKEVQASLGLQRVVVVQPSTYGLDNSCTLDAVAEFSGDARAVVVVDDRTTEAEIDQLARRGARGARFHMLPGGAVPWEIMPAVAARIAPFGWHIQLQMNGRDLIDRVDILTALPTTLVVDHVGRFMPPAEPDDELFGVLLQLVDDGRTWVKLSDLRTAPTSRTNMPRSPPVRARRSCPRAHGGATNRPHPGRQIRHR